MARLLSITRSETLDPAVRKRTIQMPFRIGPMTLSIMTIALRAVDPFMQRCNSTL